MNDRQAGTTVVTTPSDREIVSVRVFDAPRERVFAAFTDPELIPKWWGRQRRRERLPRHLPRDHATRAHRADVRVGGPAGHVIVETLTLEDLGDGRTKITGTSLFHTTEERDGMLSSGMESGLNESHDRLAELLAASA